MEVCVAALEVEAVGLAVAKHIRDVGEKRDSGAGNLKGRHLVVAKTKVMHRYGRWSDCKVSKEMMCRRQVTKVEKEDVWMNLYSNPDSPVGASQNL